VVTKIAALAVAVLAVASCASAPPGTAQASHRPAPHPRVTWYVIGGAKRFRVLAGRPVPWLAATAPPPTAVIAPGIHPCSPQHLTAKLPAMQGATMGQMAGVIRLTNTGGLPCTLRGYPRVRLLSPAGTVIPAPESRGQRLNPKPLTWPQVVIHPRATAWVNVMSSNWCGPRPASWQLVLPGTGALIIRHGWQMGLCEFRSDPSDLSVGPVEPGQASPKWPLVPMIFGRPLHASAGGSLSYVVILMNAQNRSYRFPGNCPTYTERLAIGKRLIAAERHPLNCAHLGTIPGNVAAAFAMRIKVPPGVASKATLTWALDPPFGFSRAVPVITSR
jgi:hypothetical protein